jgi:hypothetical protein
VTPDRPAAGERRMLVASVNVVVAVPDAAPVAVTL